MATVAAAKTSFEGGYTKWTWAGMGDGDVGEAVVSSLFSDRSIQFDGAFDTGSTIIAEGSNDGGTTFFTLTDPQGNPISLTSAGLKAVIEYTELIRPRVSAGTINTSLNAYLVGRRSR